MALTIRRGTVHLECSGSTVGCGGCSSQGGAGGSSMRKLTCTIFVAVVVFTGTPVFARAAPHSGGTHGTERTAGGRGGSHGGGQGHGHWGGRGWWGPPLGRGHLVGAGLVG